MVRQSIIPPPKRKFDSFSNQTGMMVKSASQHCQRAGLTLR